MNVERLKRLRERLAEQKLDALIVTNLTNIRYLSGFTGSAAVLVIADGLQHLITDARYDIQAREQAKGFKVIITRCCLNAAASLLKRKGLSRVGVEAQSFTLAQQKSLKEALCDAKSIRLMPTEGLVEGLRMVKEEGELEKLRKAIRLADAAFEHAMTILRPGITEQEAAWEVEVFMRRRGAERLAFPVIVASGRRSAMPHGAASEKKIERGDLVVLDFGAVCDGYHSDLTRTVVISKASREQHRLYRAVRDAQLKAIEGMAAGRRARHPDRLARQVLKEHGWARFFTHGLGHGVGLDIHECPRLAKTSKDILRSNMVVAVEPGVYVAEVGGVRIEDIVRITDDGVEVLTQAPKPAKLPVI